MKKDSKNLPAFQEETETCQSIFCSQREKIEKDHLSGLKTSHSEKKDTQSPLPPGLTSEAKAAVSEINDRRSVDISDPQIQMLNNQIT